MFLFGTADDKAGHSSLVLADALRANQIPVQLYSSLKTDTVIDFAKETL